MPDLSAIITGTDDLCGVTTLVVHYYTRQPVLNSLYNKPIPDFDWYIYLSVRKILAG